MLKRKEALNAVQHTLYNGNRSDARTAYQNAKNGLRNAGYKGKEMRQAARENLMYSSLPSIDVDVPEDTADLGFNSLAGLSEDYMNAKTFGGNENISVKRLPEIPQYSNEDVAKQVMMGKWGNGANRVKRLTDAGYNPAIIQKIINENASSNQQPVVRSVEDLRPDVGYATHGYDGMYGNFDYGSVPLNLGPHKPTYWENMAARDVAAYEQSPYIGDDATAAYIASAQPTIREQAEFNKDAAKTTANGMATIGSIYATPYIMEGAANSARAAKGAVQGAKATRAANASVRAQQEANMARALGYNRTPGSFAVQSMNNAPKTIRPNFNLEDWLANSGAVRDVLYKNGGSLKRLQGGGSLERARNYYRKHSNADTIRKIQNFLYGRGYYNGDLDGLFGPQTFEAIKKYQQDNNVDVDGMWGESTNSIHRVLNAADAPYRTDNSGSSGAHTKQMQGVNTGRENTTRLYKNQNELYKDIDKLYNKYYGEDGGEDWFWGDDEDATQWREFLHKTKQGQAILNEFYDNYTGDRTKLNSRKLTDDQTINNIRTVAGEKTDRVAKNLGLTLASIPLSAELLAGGVATLGGAGLSGIALPVSGIAGGMGGSWLGGKILGDVNANLHAGDDKVVLHETTPMTKNEIPVILGGDVNSYYKEQGSDLGKAIGGVSGMMFGPKAYNDIQNGGYLLGRVGSRVGGGHYTFKRSPTPVKDVARGITNEVADMFFKGHQIETFPRTAGWNFGEGAPLGKTTDIRIPTRDMLGRFTSGKSMQYDPLKLNETYPVDTRWVGSKFNGGAGLSSVVRQGQFRPYSEFSNNSILWAK